MGTQTVAALCNMGDIGQRDCVQGSWQALMTKWLMDLLGKGGEGTSQTEVYRGRAMGVWLVSAQSQLLVQFHTADPHSQ